MPANPVEYVVLTNGSFVGIRKVEMIDHKIWLIQCQKRTNSAVFCTCSMSQYTITSNLMTEVYFRRRVNVKLAFCFT